MLSFNLQIDQIGIPFIFLTQFILNNMLYFVPIRPITQVKIPHSIIFPNHNLALNTLDFLKNFIQDI